MQAGAALGQCCVRERGHSEKRKRTLFVKRQIVDCQVVANGNIPKPEGSLALGARGEQYVPAGSHGHEV